MRFIIISRLVECDVMEFQELSTLVSNVGFPIAMCLLLLHRMSTQDKIYHETEEKLRQVISLLFLVFRLELNMYSPNYNTYRSSDPGG